MAEDEDNYEDFDRPQYERPEKIDPNDLRHALGTLALFDSDTFLGMQAYNLGAVDQFIMTLEYDVLKELIESDRTPAASAMFLSAQSQMWIFLAYEILRTWRQRVRDIQKWERSGGLKAKLEALSRDRGYLHVGREMRASQIKQVMENPELSGQIETDLRRAHIPFTRLEHLRVSLAKHEVRRKGGSVALRPGYGRINYMCGALDYELEIGQYSLGTMSRRDVADEIRALANTEYVPSEADIASFDEFMRGPPDDIDRS